jgi:hypothetical protein
LSKNYTRLADRKQAQIRLFWAHEPLSGGTEARRSKEILSDVVAELC